MTFIELSKQDEEQLLKEMKAHARTQCGESVQSYSFSLF